MKKSLFATAALLAFAFSLPLRAAPSAQSWLENYYLNPAPAAVPQAFQTLSRTGYFDRAGNIPIAVGFFGTVFAQNPDRVDRWLIELNGLPMRHHRLLAAALWQAGHPMGRDLLNLLGEHSPLRAEILRLAEKQSRPVLETPVLSPSSMNLQWGAFLATGDDRHILNILDAIGLDQPGVDAAARGALARHAADHPRVLEICLAQLERQPEEARSVLRAALAGPVRSKPRI